MLLRIHHTTRYTFASPVIFGMQQLRKTPKSSYQQQVQGQWQTTVNGGVEQLVYEDHYNNMTNLITTDRGTTLLEIVSEGLVDVTDANGILGRHRGPAPLWLFTKQTPRTEAKTGVRALARQVADLPPLEALHRLVGLIGEAVTFQIGASNPDWTAEDALAAGKGVCQDHTHVFLACARRLGIPARYVSGYLMMDDRTAQDAMHAWAEAHVDGLGWVGFDVTNSISPDMRYVRVATGLDYAEAAPVSGTLSGTTPGTLEVVIDVAQQ